MPETHTNTALELAKYRGASDELNSLKEAGNYPRKTVHDINNALAKINNALWLMAREDSASTPFFIQCQQIIEQELSSAKKLLDSTP